MTYVIAEPCIGTKDTACVDVCPVDCIHEAADESSTQLYIDPAECIDCAACVPACPVEAIFAEADLSSQWQKYTLINAEFFTSGAGAAATPAGGEAATAASAPKKAKTPPKEEIPPPKAVELTHEEMYRPLSEIREELAPQRGVVPGEDTGRRRSPALIAAAAVVVLLFAYAISNNLSKSFNRDVFSRLSTMAVGDRKPSFMGDEYTLERTIDGKIYSVKVADSILGSRSLTLQIPAKPILGIYHKDEKFFAENTNQESRFYYLLIDKNSDGTLDDALVIREFWSKEKKFIGRYQNPIPPNPDLQSSYQEAAELLARHFGLRS